MAGNSNVIELVLKTSRTGTGLRDVKSELSGLQQATKAAGSTFTSFGASGKDAYGALLQTGRAAGMSQGEINQFASSLGVASSAEVEATSKMHSLISAWDAGDISSEQLTEGLGELGEGADDAAESAQGLGNVIDTAMAAAITKGAIEAGKMVYELAELGAQSLRTKAAFAAISGSADEATANLEAMQRATRGAISETEMMAQASRLMQLGLVASAAELE